MDHLDELERDLPSGPAQVHHAHLGAAASGATTYLVVWEGEYACGGGVVLWNGPPGPSARSRYAAAPAIAHLQVAAPHRGRGVGTALIEAAEALIGELGHRCAVIGVGRDNPRALQLYRRLGYHHTDIIDTLGYTWFDEEGVGHREVEQTQLLAKLLV